MPVRIRSTLRSALTWLLPLAALAGTARVSAAQYTNTDYAQMTWPQEIDTDSGKIVIYQPQPITLKGITLTARAAFSVAKGSADPVFGVMWLTARAQTDRDKRMMDIDQIVLTDVRFPDMSDSGQQTLKAQLTPKVQASHFSVPLDGLETALAASAAEQRSADSLNTTPPKIVFSSVPAVLLLYDGKPVIQPIPNSSLKAVVNTPMMVALDPTLSTY